MALRKHAAVEEADTLDDQRMVAAQAALVVTREQLLCDGHAVAVRQNVQARDAALAQQRLVQVGLVEDRQPSNVSSMMESIAAGSGPGRGASSRGDPERPGTGERAR